MVPLTERSCTIHHDTGTFLYKENNAINLQLKMDNGNLLQDQKFL